MIGINELVLNEPTMIEITQYYFDKVLFSDEVKVTNVKCRDVNGALVFIITTEASLSSK